MTTETHFSGERTNQKEDENKKPKKRRKIPKIK